MWPARASQEPHGEEGEMMSTDQAEDEPLENTNEGEATQEGPARDTTDWKAEARKWEQRAKANSDAAARLQTLEDSQKTELQKASDRASRAEARVAELESEHLRHEVASEKSVPVALLYGNTREELEAAADALLQFKGTQGAQGPFVPSSGSNPKAKGDSLREFTRSVFNTQNNQA